MQGSAIIQDEDDMLICTFRNTNNRTIEWMTRSSPRDFSYMNSIGHDVISLPVNAINEPFTDSTLPTAA